MPKKRVGHSPPSESGVPSAELLARAKAGDTRAVSALFRRHGDGLRRWARGRLPRWARAWNDTADIVQDALLQTFRRIDRIEHRGKGALRAYLQQAVDNRIKDELRRVSRRPVAVVDEVLLTVPDGSPSPFEEASLAERELAYKNALMSLSEDERILIVSCLEMGYTYEQIALITGRRTSEAARMAVRRAVKKLAKRIAGGEPHGR